MFLYPHFGSFFLFYLCGGRCFYLVYLESLIRRLFLIYTPLYLSKKKMYSFENWDRAYTKDQTLSRLVEFWVRRRFFWAPYLFVITGP